MAKFIIKDAVVTINSQALSDRVKTVTIDYSADQQDATAMSDDTKVNLAGLKDWTMTFEFHQDYAASNVDATMFGLVGAAAFPVTVKPTSGAISATNPEFQGTATLENYGGVVGGSVGDIAGASATFKPGGGDLVRDVTP